MLSYGCHTFGNGVLDHIRQSVVLPMSSKDLSTPFEHASQFLFFCCAEILVFVFHGHYIWEHHYIWLALGSPGTCQLPQFFNVDGALIQITC